MALDWSPGSSTTATGDLLSLNVGANGVLGNIFNVKDNTSSVFSVSQTAVTANLPASFTAAGDVSVAYDINFTNPTASYIKSAAPLYITAGETFNSSDLTFATYNKGRVNINTEALEVTGSASISGVLGIGTTAPEALLEVQGAEATDAVLALDADDGDDAADTWFIKSLASDNSLSLLNATTEVANLSSGGNLQIDGALTVDGTGGITVAGAASTGLNFSNTGITTDINLQNGETIDNNTNGTIALTATTIAPSGNIDMADAMWIGLDSTNTIDFNDAATDNININGRTRLTGIDTGTTAGSLCRDSDANFDVVYYNGGLNSCLASTRKVKHDITYVDNAGLDQILQLNPVTFIYDWDDTNTTRLGFIAEDAAAVNPLFVAYDEEGNPKALSDYGIEAATVQAVKELNSKIEIASSSTQARIASLEADLSISNSGNLNIVEQNLNQFAVIDGSNRTITRVAALAQGVLGKVRAGIIDVQILTVRNLTAFSANISTANIGDLTTNTLAIATDQVTIAGQTLRDYITFVVNDVISNSEFLISKQNANVENLKTSYISPLSEEKSAKIAIKLNDNNGQSKLEIQNASGSAVASFDSAGNATLSGSLTANDLTTKNVRSEQLEVSSDASVSGTLRAQRIIADQIEGFTASNSASQTINNYYISSPSAEASQSADQQFNNLAIEQLAVNNLAVNNGLMSFGPSSFFELSVADNLSVGANLVLANTSINVLGSDLKLQPLKQGGVSIADGGVYINSEGDLSVKGNATFAKNVTIEGSLFANIISPLPNQNLNINLASGSGSLNVNNASNSAILTINSEGNLTSSGEATFGKLNLNLVGTVEAISDTEVVATGSAGRVTLSAYEREITVKNSLVTNNSLIYITPAENTGTQSLYLMRQIAEDKPRGIEGSFTVGTSLPVNKNIPFNFLIIN